MAVAGRSVCLLCVLSQLQACSVWSYELGDAMTPADMPQQGQGVMLAEVLDKLGPPLRISATVNGYVMAWEYWHITERSVGFSLGVAGADFLSIDWGTANASGNGILLSFDRAHRLLSSDFEQWNRDAGGGSGVQPLFGAVEVVDVQDLLRRMPQHDWGAGSLEPLPTALNSDNRLNTGQNGIQQRGTTRSVGQHTLELHR